MGSTPSMGCASVDNVAAASGAEGRSSMSRRKQVRDSSDFLCKPSRPSAIRGLLAVAKAE